MKKTRTQLKRFVFGFMACIIAFLAAFVFVPVRSFADSSTCTITFIMNRQVSSWKYEYKVYNASYSLIETVTSPVAYSRSDRPSIIFTFDNSYTIEFYAFQPGSSGIIYSNDFSLQRYSPSIITSSELTFTFNNSIGSPYFVANALKFNIVSVTPTPSPTSTPTPTPNPYGNELGELTEINNHLFGAVGAITTSANNAGFWSSFLFIGLPLFILILSIIAWIIFGGED